MTWHGRPRTRADRKASQIVLDRANHRCEIRGPHCTGIATEDDHIRNIASGGDRYDLANRQAACHTCHAAKTKTEALAGIARRETKKRRRVERAPGLTD